MDLNMADPSKDELRLEANPPRLKDPLRLKDSFRFIMICMVLAFLRFARESLVAEEFVKEVRNHKTIIEKPLWIDVNTRPENLLPIL